MFLNSGLTMVFERLAFFVKPTFCMICLCGIMESVGFTNKSNNSYCDSRS